MAVLVFVSLLLKRTDPEYFEQIEILLLRVPVFVIGVWFGKLAYAHTKVPSWLPLCAALFTCVYVGHISHTIVALSFLWRYAYIPLTVSLVLAISWLHGIWQCGALEKPLVLIGGYSLEIYLLYEGLYLGLGGVLRASDSVGITYAAAIFVLSFLLSVGLRHIQMLLERSFQEE